MNKLPKALYTVEQIRRVESLAINQLQISESTLMETAGLAAYNSLRQAYPKVNKLTIICGKGNNGGDGYVLGRLASEGGLQVQLISLCNISELPDTARAAALACQSKGLKIQAFNETNKISADLIVDAVLGIGIKGQVRGRPLAAIRMMNQSVSPVFSLDIPSGLDADTGQVLGEVSRADATVTFIGLKQGLATGSAAEYCGQIDCHDLNLQSLIAKIPASAMQISFPQFKGLLSPRPRDAHKGKFGHVLVVGGDFGMPGAVRMAAEAALRVGAGLVSVVTRKEHLASVVGSRPELMCYPIEHAKDKHFQSLLARANVVNIGPGLGESRWSVELLKTVLRTQLPLVVDASALNLIAQQRPIKRDNWILTPHPGEAARLLGTTSQVVQADRYNSIKLLHALLGGVVVLKGSGTLILGDSHLPTVCRAGNPGMASAGMGDILSGIIAGLLAQGLQRLTSAQLGVCLHACAGDLAAKQGERGTLACDLFYYLRQLVNP